MLYKNKNIVWLLLFSLVVLPITTTHALLLETSNSQSLSKQKQELLQVELQNEQSSNSASNNPAQNVSKLKNLAAFFSTMFNLNNSFRFIGDDMFIKNQCLRADILTLHRSLDGISDNMLDNYRTLTEAQLQIQKDLYQEINAELIFLRNIDILLNENKTEYDLSQDSLNKLRFRLEDKVPKDFSSKLPLFFSIWIETYQDRFQTYLECPNSWQAVNKRVENIVKTAEKISNNSSEFSDAFAGLGQTIGDTPGAFWDNSTSTISSSFLNSYNQTRQNFNNSITQIRQEFTAMQQDRQRFLAEFKTVNTARFEDLAGMQQSGTGLIGITQTSLDSLARSSQDSLMATQSTELLVNSVFNDSANLLVLDNLIDLNANLVGINQTLTADGVGVNTLVNEVAILQCR